MRMASGDTRLAVSSSPVRPFLVLGACCLSLFLVMMDVTIVNVALPSIRLAFDAGLPALQWIVDAYTLVVSALLMVAGTLADRFGRRRIFLTGIVVFCLASALCGMATSSGALIAARALQGVGGAMLNPVALSIITNTFTQPAARARAIGLWGMMSGAALAIGPVAGGAISDFFGWRMVFWINLPIGVLALILTLRFIPESRSPVPRRFDFPGQSFAVLTTVALVAALIEGPGFGWGSSPIRGLFVLAAVGSVSFVLIERRRAEPMLDMRFFRSPPFASSVILAVLCFAIFASLLFLNTLYLQEFCGMTPGRAGLELMPLAVAVMIGAPLSGRLVAARGARLPLLLAAGGLTAGPLMLTGLDATVSWGWRAAGYAVLGAGFGLCNAPITNAAVSGMPRRQAGVAAAVASTSRQIGTALGVAIAGSVGAAEALQASAGGRLSADFLGLMRSVCWLAAGGGVLVGVIALLGTSRHAQLVARRMADGFDSSPQG
ncbi:MFS transporter [Acetobacter estunensis]|uniref:MFS transporter n=1 Tax=Acetobacter estunensis TaxID=104097 RepID=UPI0020C4E6B7|nr:MFS transporter [Acetobacter estunensis]